MTDTYNPDHDFSESLKLGYTAIRDRESAKPEHLRNYDFAKREHQPQKIEDRPFGIPL